MSFYYDIAKKIAEDAVILARMKAQEQMNIKTSTLMAMYPIANEDGSFGIGIEPRAYYLFFQNYGIKPFTMWSLSGKTIPIRLPSGRVIFRVASDVGKPGRIKERDEKGRIKKGNVGVKWRHPGLAPKNFIEWGLSESIKQNYNKEIKKAFNTAINKSAIEKMSRRA